MLLTLALQNAEKIINSYLNLDPETPNKLIALSGSVLKIEILTIEMQFYIKIIDHNIKLIQHHNDLADTIIRGTPLALLSLLQVNNENTHAILQNKNITLIGNIEIAQQLKNSFSQIEIDWEEYISKICGDPFAHFISKQFLKFKNWTTHTNQSLHRNINEYIHEEANLFPSHFAYIDLYDDIDTLRDDVERLMQRLDRIQKTLSEQGR